MNGEVALTGNERRALALQRAGAKRAPAASVADARRALALAGGRRPLAAAEDMMAAAVVLGVTLFLALASGTPALAWSFGGCAGIGLALKLVVGPSLRVRYLTIPGAFLAAYFVLMSLAAVYVHGEMEHWVRDAYFLAVQSVLVTFPLGVIAASGLFRGSAARAARYARERLHAGPGDRQFSRLVIVVFWAALAVAAVYVSVSEFVPILKLVFDYSSQIDDVSLRFTVSELPRVLLFFLALARSLALPFCTLYLYYMSQVGGRRWRRDFAFVFAASTAIACLSLERAPLMALCGMLALGVAIANMHRPLRLRAAAALALVAALALGLAGFISALQYDSDVTVAEVGDGVRHVVVNRVLLASARAAALAFEEFPAPEHQLGGRYVRMFNILRGGEYLESRYAPRLVILPVSFVGDLWRNWGWPAVLAGGFVVGFLAQCVQQTLFVRKTVIAAVFQAILCLAFIWLIPGNAFGIVTTSLLLGAWAAGWAAIRRSTGASAGQTNNPVAAEAGRTRLAAPALRHARRQA
jgi:hypothetical protein